MIVVLIFSRYVHHPHTAKLQNVTAVLAPIFEKDTISNWAIYVLPSWIIHNHPVFGCEFDLQDCSLFLQLQCAKKTFDQYYHSTVLALGQQVYVSRFWATKLMTKSVHTLIFHGLSIYVCVGLQMFFSLTGNIDLSWTVNKLIWPWPLAEPYWI